MFDSIKGPSGPCGFDMMWGVGSDSDELQVLIVWVKSLEDDNRNILNELYELDTVFVFVRVTNPVSPGLLFFFNVFRPSLLSIQVSMYSPC